MNHAGESFPDGLPTDLVSGYELVLPPTRTLAIVGSHPKGRDGIPWDDPSVEIWLFNEAPLKPEKYPRFDALMQIHRPEVYSAPNNWVNTNYWPWLQERRGKPIYMLEVDPRVPDSVKYPLEEILEMIAPLKYLRSSPAMALALGIYLGYRKIMLFGSELTSNTEYAYQATNYAFWVGFAKGRGIDLELHCWQDEFFQRIYGYEGELQIDREFFTKRADMIRPAWEINAKQVKRTQERLDAAMLEAKFQDVANLSLQLDMQYQAAGETYGGLSEAERYAKREDEISRQEFERCSAQALKDGEELRSKKDHAGGKVEYVWNVWRMHGTLAALEQLRAFLKEKNQFAYEAGVKSGVYQENIACMVEYDKRLRAAGGVRALGRPEEYKGPGA